uniref:ATP synthase F0 subunit 8 n=1 Tax=Ganaspini sp. ZJUH 20220007 TaxID=2943474 RepID=A0A9E8K0S3_9HYME|nr:ATP synthase F0 subunit 8 [Ganaspini sp. ZJUH 20220007]
MPQMKPMNWLILLMFFIMSFMMTMKLIHFNFFNWNLNLLMTNKMKKDSKINLFKFKW